MGQGPLKWLPIEFGQIYTYLSDSPGIFIKEKLRVYKSLDAYDYYIRFVCNYLIDSLFTVVWQAIFVHTGTDCLCVLVKAKVKPSQQLTENPPEAWVGINAKGSIIAGHCTCIAMLFCSFGETCSHVAGILFKMEAYIRLEIGKQTYTSVPCEWNKACTMKVPLSINYHNINK